MKPRRAKDEIELDARQSVAYSIPNSPPAYASAETHIHHEKSCSGCKKTKALADFHKNKGKADGRDARCKLCTSKSKKSQYKAKTRSRRRTIGFDTSISGNLCQKAIEEFSTNLVNSIQELIDEKEL
jgi:hypothetical protein